MTLRLVLSGLLLMGLACSDRDPPMEVDSGSSDARTSDAPMLDDAPIFDDAPMSVDAPVSEDAPSMDSGPVDSGPDADSGPVDSGPDADTGPIDSGSGSGPMCSDVCTPTCFRPINCTLACGTRSIGCGCCGCVAPAFDDISCDAES
jgi:hypothetical protein